MWLGDIHFVLDQLVRWNTTDPRLAGHLALQHIGMFGHSFAGTIVLAAGASDPRLPPVIDIDGSMSIGKTNGHYLQHPMMLMLSDDP